MGNSSEDILSTLIAGPPGLRLPPQRHDRHSQKESKLRHALISLSILNTFFPKSSGDSRDLPPPIKSLQSEIQGGKTLREGFRSLSEKEKEEIASNVGRRNLSSILSISEGSDDRLFWKDILHFGQRLKKNDQLQGAMGVFECLMGAGETVPSEIRKKAEEELNAMVGKGAVAPRLEFLASQFIKDATDYKMIIPMIAGSAVYQLARTAALSKIASASKTLWWSRGLAARFLSGAVGFAAEVPTFSFLGQGLRYASGEPVGDLGKELGSAALTLGLLKGTSFLGGQLFYKLHGINEVGQATRLMGFTKVSQFLFPQGSMFTGLLAAHKLEERLGWRHQVDGATTVTDTLASLVSLGVGSHLGYRILGSRFAAFQKKLGIRAHILSQRVEQRKSSRFTFSPGFLPSKATAGALAAAGGVTLWSTMAEAAVKGGELLSHGGSQGLLIGLGTTAGLGLFGMAVSKGRKGGAYRDHAAGSSRSLGEIQVFMENQEAIRKIYREPDLRTSSEAERKSFGNPLGIFPSHERIKIYADLRFNLDGTIDPDSSMIHFGKIPESSNGVLIEMRQSRGMGFPSRERIMMGKVYIPYKIQGSEEEIQRYQSELWFQAWFQAKHHVQMRALFKVNPVRGVVAHERIPDVQELSDSIGYPIMTLHRKEMDYGKDSKMELQDADLYIEVGLREGVATPVGSYPSSDPSALSFVRAFVPLLGGQNFSGRGIEKIPPRNPYPYECRIIPSSDQYPTYRIRDFSQTQISGFLSAKTQFFLRRTKDRYEIRQGELIKETYKRGFWGWLLGKKPILTGGPTKLNGKQLSDQWSPLAAGDKIHFGPSQITWTEPTSREKGGNSHH